MRAASGIPTQCVSGAGLRELVTEMDGFKEQYAKPLYRMSVTFLEIFPLGLLIALLSAAVLRNSKVLASTA